MKLAELRARRGVVRVATPARPGLGAGLLAALLLALLLTPLAGRTARASGHAPPPRLGEAQRAYHAELVARAAAQRLWAQRYWQVLLHYRENRVWPGLTSEADGAGFFNAPNGREDPRAELEWTLARFFTEDILEPGQMTAQCTFPARYRWLKAELGFDGERLPEQDCPRFQRWRSSLDPGGVTLIYASYYFNVPASMFGHTLLRYDKKERAEGERLLDYGVNYAAFTDPDDSGITYALKGLFGGYRGAFSLLPYYMKVREYNDVENRDLWEYRLDFTQEQIDRMLLHTWELGSTDFDYFFFSENCSYHLLSLLEAGNPELRLTDRFQLFTLPIDTVRAVVEQPGLVVGVEHRPSRSSQAQRKLRGLAGADRDLALALAGNPALLDGDALAQRPPERRAHILESAADVFRLDITDSRAATPEQRAGLRRLLVARSRIPLTLDDPPEPETQPLPHTGHASSWFEVGLGADRDERGFVDLSARPVMRDLMTDETGYPPNSDVQLGAVRVRVEEVPVPQGPENPTGDPDETERKVRLQQFHIAQVYSIFVWTELEKSLSWRVRAGWERTREGGLPCEPCTPFVLDGGVGIALQADVPTRIVTFSMLEPVLHVGSMFEDDYRLGLGLALGIMIDLGPRWRVGMFGRSTEFFAGDAEDRNVGQATLTQRITLSRNVDLRLDWFGIEDYREGRIALGFYF